MKILFAVNCFSGGASNVIQLLAMQFRDHGYNVEILLYDGVDVPSRYDLTNIKIIDLQKLKPIKSSSTMGRILHLIKSAREIFEQEAPDVIVSFLDSLNIITCFAGWNLKIPIIVSERNDTIKIQPKFPWNYFRTIAYKRADTIVVQCSIFKKFCKSRFAKKTLVISNPIVKPNFDHIPVEKNIVELVAVGRLHEQKNFSWLIDTFASLYHNDSRLRLRIYGEGPEHEKLQKLVYAKGISDVVSLEGYSTHIHELISKGDIYVMSSLYEGFPNSLCEAMAVGLPSVALKCHDGLTDIINNGINGFLISMGDENSFITTINQLSNNLQLRKKISLEAKKIADTYSLSAIYLLWEEEIVRVYGKYGQTNYFGDDF